MSFRADAQYVRKTNGFIWLRLRALRRCIHRISFETPGGYEHRLDSLDVTFGFERRYPRTDPPTESQLLNTLHAIEIEHLRLSYQRRQSELQSRLLREARKNRQRLLSPVLYIAQPDDSWETFRAKVSRPIVTLVFFRSPYDDSSRRLAVVLRKATKRIADSLILLDAETQGNFPLYRMLNFTNTPTMLAFLSNVEIARRGGFGTESDIRDWIERLTLA